MRVGSKRGFVYLKARLEYFVSPTAHVMLFIGLDHWMDVTLAHILSKRNILW